MREEPGNLTRGMPDISPNMWPAYISLHFSPFICGWPQMTHHHHLLKPPRCLTERDPHHLQFPGDFPTRRGGGTLRSTTTRTWSAPLPPLLLTPVPLSHSPLNTGCHIHPIIIITVAINNSNEVYLIFSHKWKLPELLLMKQDAVSDQMKGALWCQSI